MIMMMIMIMMMMRMSGQSQGDGGRVVETCSEIQVQMEIGSI